MATKTPIKLVDLGSGQGSLKEFETGDTLPAAVMPSTDSIGEGVSNLYFTQARVRATPLTGFSATNSAVTAADTALVAFGKLQGQVSTKSELGVGQTWQDMTSSRAEGVNYTNTSGKPIQMVATFGPAANNQTMTRITIDGITVQGVYAPAGSYSASAAAVIPPGSVYRVDVITSPGSALVAWRELR